MPFPTLRRMMQVLFARTFGEQVTHILAPLAILAPTTIILLNPPIIVAMLQSAPQLASLVLTLFRVHKGIK